MTINAVLRTFTLAMAGLLVWLSAGTSVFSQEQATDYDTDDDGLIEIRNLEQLNAVRWDLDGNGAVASGNEADYQAAFPSPLDSMGCPDTCTGYELMRNLDFDNAASYAAATVNADWSDPDETGAGWAPLATSANRYEATFDGNRRTISNLFINRASGLQGLFATIGDSGLVRDLHLVGVSVASTTGNEVGGLAGYSTGLITGVSVTGTVRGGGDQVGGLVGKNEGTVSYSRATGTVGGAGFQIGGLAGANHGTVSHSHSSATVTVIGTSGGDMGGLVGKNFGTQHDLNLGEPGRVIASYATGPVTGRRELGGLVGKNEGHVIASYATGPVTGTGTDVGGLVGDNNQGNSNGADRGHIVASYATGPVRGTANVGGLVGLNQGDVRNSYSDTGTSGLTAAFNNGAGASVTNVSGKTTAELQTPTERDKDTNADPVGYPGIYSAWNVSIDGDSTGDDPWDFGDAGEYPALKADFNGDDTATWQEFGFQLRQALRLRGSMTDDGERAIFSWEAVTSSGRRVTYVLYRDEVRVHTTTRSSYTDQGPEPGRSYTWRLVATVGGQQAGHSNELTLGEHDRDGDGLIEIRSLAQLNAIRWDLDGNGTPSSGNETAYTAAFGATPCPGTCTGYELGADLDFDEDNDGMITSGDAAYWNGGSGWTPIGSGTGGFEAVFEGNGHTISNLFINTGAVDDFGLFNIIAPTGSVSGLGLPSVDVTYTSDDVLIGTGALAGINEGTITGSYATGTVSGVNAVGGLAGSSSGEVRHSHADVTVTGTDNVGGLVGDNGGLITGSYATGAVSGQGNVGGLAGVNSGEGTIRRSYASGAVTGGANLGGLVGLNNGFVLGSYATGTVTGAVMADENVHTNIVGGSSTGGLVGNNAGTIRGSYASGAATGGAGVGGLVGVNFAFVLGSYATGTVTGAESLGGLAGQNIGTIRAAYATGTIARGAVGRHINLGGLVGRQESDGSVEASYSTGPGGFGGLVGFNQPSGTITNSYSDTATSGRMNAFNYDATNPDSLTNVTNASGKTTAELQAPTTYGLSTDTPPSIYAAWNVDADGDSTADDPWDFGSNIQYPVLKADLDGDGDATWQEFGFQVRERLVLGGELDPAGRSADLTWNAIETPQAWGNAVRWRLYRNDAEAATPVIGTTSRQETSLMAGQSYTWQLAVTGAGVELRRSNRLTLGEHDRDGDGLIEIRNLEQLNAIRYDLNGDGMVDTGTDQAGIDAYAAAFGSTPCPGVCTGYELEADLDFDAGASYASGTINDDWSDPDEDGAGWSPIGPGFSGYSGIFEGNRHTISNLFINRTSNRIGLFGNLWETGVVRDLYLVDVNVSGGESVGGLAGINDGTITNSYTTGRVSGTRDVGGLAGFQGGAITNSYSTAAVTGNSYVGGLVGENNEGSIVVSYAAGPVSGVNSVGGLSGRNNSGLSTDPGGIIASYATGPVTGTDKVGGLVGENGDNGGINASYATGTVTGSTNVGGLIGRDTGTGTSRTASYFDTQTSGLTAAVGSGPDTGASGLTTMELQAPTAYTTPPGTYSSWSVDLDGDSTGDDPWHFGNADEYPALQVDFNGDDSATWQEFGYQLREAPEIRVTGQGVRGRGTPVALSWTSVTNTHWTPRPTVTYALYRDGVRIRDAGSGRSHSDSDAAVATTYGYQVAALLNGVEARRGNLLSWTPAGPPGPPTGVMVQPGNRKLTVSWTAPTNTGGAELTGYRATAVPGGRTCTADTAPTLATTCEITGLTNGVSYSVTVTATNEAGFRSAASTAAADTPVEAAITLSLTRLEVNENGGTGDYTVVLTRQPTAAVTVNIAGVAGAATVNKTSLTFTTTTDQAVSGTTSGWNVAQTVTITGVDDDVDNAGDQRLATITHSIADDAAAVEYRGADATLTVTLDDDDTRGVTVTPTAVTVTEASAGRTEVYTVVLDTQPTGPVTISVTSANPGVATVSTADLTFTTANWNTAQTVTVTGVDDDVDSDRTTVISHRASGGDYGRVRVASVDVTLTDDDTRRVTIPVTVQTVTEAGGTATYTVVLDSQPTGPVTVTVRSGDPGAARVSAGGSIPSSLVRLTFTTTRNAPVSGRTAGWNVVQTVTVTGVNDDVDSDRTATITHAASGGDYGGVTGADVTVTVTNDDTRGVTVDTDPGTDGVQTANLAVTEAPGEGNTATYTVVLNSRPTATVTITVSNPDESAISVRATRLIFQPGNWNRAQTVTVRGLQDDDSTSESGITLTHSVSGGDYDAVTAASVTVNVTDDDTPGIRVSRTEVNRLAEESGTARYTVRLNTQPTSNVLIGVATDDASIATVSSATGTPVSNGVRLTFEPDNANDRAWDREQTVTVTGVNDDVDNRPDRTTFILHGVIDDQSADEYDPVDDVRLPVTLRDDDTAGVTIDADPDTDGVQSPRRTTLAVTEASGEGNTDTYTVVLTSQPTADVVITLTSSDQAASVPLPLTFDASNWNMPQTVTVTGVQDDDAVDDVVTVTHAVDAAQSADEYDGLTIDDVTVRTEDDDEPGVTLSQTTRTVTEDLGGRTTTYTVVLDTEPTAPVTVTLTSSDRGTALVWPPALVFEPNDDNGLIWSTAQTVTVTGVDDRAVNVPARTAEIRHTATGGDYGGVTGSPVTVTVTDNDTASVSIFPTTVTVPEGGTAAYWVSLGTRPSVNVVIGVSLADGGDPEISIFPASLSFTSSNWDRPRMVTVRAAEDDADTTNGSATIQHTVADGSAAEYAALTSLPQVSAVEADNDAAGLALSPATLLVGEGRSASYRVRLNTDPGATVIVTPSSGAANVATVSEALTFDSSNWNRYQTVTVTAVDNDVADLTMAAAQVNIGHTVSGYAVTPGSVVVYVTDDDAVGMRFSRSSVSPQENGEATYTVRLTSQPSGSVTVTLQISGDGDLTLDTDADTAGDQNTLTFTATKDQAASGTTSGWNVPQTVTVRAAEDADRTNGRAVIRHSVTAGGYGNLILDLNVSESDNDQPPRRPRTIPNQPPEVSGPVDFEYSEGFEDPVATYSAVDPEGSDVTWSLAGDDAGAFSIDEAGVLSFAAPPDYEAPTDADGDNVYLVTVRAADSGQAVGVLEIRVTVTDLDVARKYDEDEDGSISRGEAIKAIADYFRNVIDRAEAVEAVRLLFAE